MQCSAGGTQRRVALRSKARPRGCAPRHHADRLFLLRLDLEDRRLGLEAGPRRRERLEALVVAGAQQVRAHARVEGQVLVDLVAVALERELPDLLVERPLDRGIALEEVVPADAAEHLAAVPVRLDAVAQRPGLHVLVDQVEHLADVLVVADRLELLVGCVVVGLAQHPVVTGVAGQHRDVLRVEVGVHREDVVLEPAAALREADAVLVEQRLAEQLVRGQQPHERRPLERDVLAVALEHRAGDELALADDLADHDVGLVAQGAVVHALERALAEPVVVVDEVDVLAAGHLDAEVARLARPAGVGDVLHADVSCSAASASSRASVLVVDPSSTKMTSYSSGGSVGRAGTRCTRRCWGPGCRPGTMTLTFSTAHHATADRRVRRCRP